MAYTTIEQTTVTEGIDSIAALLIDSMLEAISSYDDKRATNIIDTYIGVVESRELYAALTIRAMRDVEEVLFSTDDMISFILNTHLIFMCRLALDLETYKGLTNIINALAAQLDKDNYSILSATREFISQVEVPDKSAFSIGIDFKGWYSVIILTHLYIEEIKTALSNVYTATSSES